MESALARGPGWDAHGSVQLERPGQHRFQGKCLEKVNEFKYLLFCIFKKYSFRPH